jgi:hypothetical protein
MKLKVSAREMLDYISKLQRPKPSRVEDFIILKSEVQEPEPVRRPVWELENAD